ncbi:hypothetical protein LCGC14_0232650 [marine sediment metagenome]|uniref:Uncharacterized protein n=1 Tax=marine sediment metagenome TaxID=412755 RepID=A0A0F9UEQ1_9ZZZZ
MTTRKTLFTVEGGGDFPADMLRYDNCWPYMSVDAAKAFPGKHGSPDEFRRREVRLLMAGDEPPTEERWKSFMWKVTNIQQL